MVSSHLIPKENMLRVLTRRDPEYVPYRQWPRYIPGMELISSPGALSPTTGKDIWGVGWTSAGNKWESYPDLHPCVSASEVANIVFPDSEKMVAGLTEQLSSVDRDSALVIVHQPRGLFERSHLLLGMEDLMVAMKESPEELSTFYNRLADYYIQLARIHCDMGLDGLRVTDDYGMQKALLISPDMWRHFIKPAMARWIKAYKQNGKFFFLHSCGYITPIMDDLVEIGIDMIDSLNPSAGNDLGDWKTRYGDKLNFMGGVDTHYVLTRGTPQEVRQEVKLRLDQLREGGGFILGPDQNIPFPEDNYNAYVEAAEEFCRY